MTAQINGQPSQAGQGRVSWNRLAGLRPRDGRHNVELHVLDARLGACEVCDSRVGNLCAVNGKGLDLDGTAPGFAQRAMHSCPKNRWPGERPICTSLGRPLNADEAKEQGVDVTKCGCLNKLRKCSEHGQCTTGEPREGFACCLTCLDYESSDPNWVEAAPAPAGSEPVGAVLDPRDDAQLNADAKARSLARLPPATVTTVDVPERPVMPDPPQLTWAVGVMTVPERSNLLNHTLASLCEAGFDKADMRLFVDGAQDSQPHESLHGIAATARWPRMGIHGNWLLSMHELVIRRPNADRFVIFQDDLLAAPRLREYLERCPFPERGYWNLFNFLGNDFETPHGPRAKGYLGWYLSNQLGKGALGLVFDRLNVVRVLTAEHMVKRPLDTWNHENPLMRVRGTHAVDGGVVEAMKKAGCQEWVHYPSLLSHTGDESTQPKPEAIMNGRDASAASDRKRWVGNASSFNSQFDPLTLLK